MWDSERDKEGSRDRERKELFEIYLESAKEKIKQGMGRERWSKCMRINTEFIYGVLWAVI